MQKGWICTKSDPANGSRPASPADPANASRPASPADPANGSRPASPADPAGASRPGDLGNSTGAAGVSRPADPANGSRPASPADTVRKAWWLPFAAVAIVINLVAVVFSFATSGGPSSRGQLAQTAEETQGARDDVGDANRTRDEKDERSDKMQVFTGTVRRMTIDEREKEIGMEGWDAYRGDLPIAMLKLDEPQEVYGMAGDDPSRIDCVTLDEVGIEIENADELGLVDGEHVTLRSKGMFFPSSSYGAIQRAVGSFEQL